MCKCHGFLILQVCNFCSQVSNQTYYITLSPLITIQRIRTNNRYWPYQYHQLHGWQTSCDYHPFLPILFQILWLFPPKWIGSKWIYKLNLVDKSTGLDVWKYNTNMKAPLTNLFQPPQSHLWIWPQTYLS